MRGSILWENPGLALLAILAVIALVLAFPVVAAIRRSRAARHREPLRMHEPRAFGGYDDYPDQHYDPPTYAGSYFRDDRGERDSSRWNERDGRGAAALQGTFGSGHPRRKPPGLAGLARGLWFVFGVAVGMALMALWSNPPGVASLTPLLALFEAPEPSAVADAPVAPAKTKVQERVATAGRTGSAKPAVAADEEAGALIDAFVTTLRDQVPMAVGPGITMATVDAASNAIVLGFTINQAVADEDTPRLQNELETRFRDSVCAAEPNPRNIHGLNERGVAFVISYTDLLGKSVAALTVQPKYCSSPA